MKHRRYYGWKRFWYPRGGSISLIDGGYLANPDGPYGNYLNPALRLFGEVAELPCLALLGEPGIGKTETMRAERAAIDAAVLAEGGRTLWLDLRSCGSEQRLDAKLFGSSEFASWVKGDRRLHVFLDSLDECLLRVDTVAALLVDEFRNCPVERLSLRIGCRTAEWPSLLEEGLRELWPEGGFEAYELAPLRRVDVITAATANKLDPEAFLRAVDEAEAVPLAIKPVTLDFLMGSYRATGGFPTRQADLYLEGCRWLCEERNDSRVASGRTGELTPDQRVAVAARIAAVTVFSNKYAVWNGVQQAAPEEEDVLVRTLAGGTESVGEDEFAVGEDALREVLGTGLFSARGPERLGWVHQTYAEFLAAHYLAQRGVAMGQAMSLFGHPDDEEGRLVPQLHEAAAWLASMSPEVFRAVIGADPEVLLRSDVASTDVEGKAALVGTLLRLYNEEKLLDVGWGSRERYRKLEHPGIGEQLRPYIVDVGKGLVVRRVALDIAEACELRSLQEDAAEVALDASQELLVRKEAAHFVASVGDGPTRARLIPLALGMAGDDPDDDLKGNGLRAVWPECVSAEDLFGMLTPPKRANYMGPYQSFLTYDLTNRLSTDDLPAALAWVEGRGSYHEDPFRFGELADQIMQQAWAELPNPGVAPAFVRAAFARLRRHEDVVKERSEVFAAISEPIFSERVAADHRRRRLLLEEMIGLLESKDDAHLLVHWRTPMVTNEDVEWLVEMLRSEAFDQRKAVLAAIVGQTFYLWDDESYELVYLAHLEDSVLAREVSRFFAPVELGSEEAETLRRYHQQWSRWEDDEDSQRPDPPVAARVASGLDAFEAGDVEAFWTDVYHFMQFDARGFASVSGAEWDMTELPGWEAADDETRARIVEAAKRYVLEGNPRMEEWLGKNIIYRPAFAGYRALRLLLKLAPGFITELSAEVWEKWTPIILDFPVILNTEEEKGPHVELVARAYEHAPDTLISTLLVLVDQENAREGYFSVTRGLARCWDDRLARAVLEKAKDPALKPHTLGVLLEDLLGYGLPEARDFAELLVASVVPEASEEQRERAVAVARVLCFGTEDSGWDVLWPVMQNDDEFAGAVVDEISAGAHHSDLPQKHLTERQVADLYVWLVRRYPHSEYFLDSSDGMITYGRKEYISEWRDDVLRHLQNRGTFEACWEIERVAAELPERRESLKWTLYQARAEARRQTWLPPEPEQVLALAARPWARLVQNGSQLLEVLVESLGRLEEKLQGETPMAPALWNLVGGSYTPKDEDWFSDYVKLHLQEDLTRRGVVLTREVVIRKGEGEGRGERTDIHVDAVVPGSGPEMPDLVSVIIEAKGCWNSELDSAIEEQLVDRYLKDNPMCRHGLYLVGWFNCGQWDEGDWRKGRAPKYSLGEARERFAEQARALSEQGLHMRAVVVNAALR